MLNVHHIYFRSASPTDLESASRVYPLTVKISTKFEVDVTIRCHSDTVLAAHTLRDLEIFDLSTLVHGVSHDQPLH